MATTRKILTKAQVEALLSQYIATQTAAEKQARAAYDASVDAARATEQQELNARAQEEVDTAAAAYDAQVVKALVGKRRLAEGLANYGLSHSGAMAAGQAAAERRQQVARQTLAQKRDEALQTLTQKSETLKKSAEAKKQQNTASSEKTLQKSIAEKRLSLSKLMY